MTRVRLGSFVIEHNERNRMNRALPVYSVTNSRGFCQQYFNKVVASEDRSTYKIVPHNCFAYNPSRINVGSIDWQRYEESVIVSPLYVVFSTSDEIDNQFLYYYLKSDVALTYIKNWGQGSVRDNLKFTQLSQIPVNVYPIEEQQLIAQRLDVLSKLISLRQRQAKKLDELVKARFVEMFGDPVRNTKQFPLVELQDLYDVSSSKRVYQDEMVLNGIPFLRISDIVEKSSNDKCTPQCFISQEMYDQLSQKGLTPNVGDILVTSRGTLGLCYEVKPGEKFYFQDGMISWLYNRKDCVINTYLLYAFRMPGIRKQIDGSNDGSTVSYLSIARLKRLKIELPPLALQTEFSHFVHEVDREKERIQRSAALLETLKRSLMQQYFG